MFGKYMNLDILKKLVNLANNNPNEHEANSAARKACQLIKESEFKFDVDQSQQPTGTWGGFSDFRPTKRQEDFYQQYAASWENERSKRTRCGQCGLEANIYDFGGLRYCSNCYARI